MSDYDLIRDKSRELFKIFDGDIEAFFGDDKGKESLWLNPKIKNAESLHKLEGVVPVLSDKPKRKRNEKIK